MSKSFSKVIVAVSAAVSVAAVGSATTAQAESHSFSDSARAPETHSTTPATKAPSARAARNAVVTVKPIKRKKRTVYRIRISNHIGDAYLKWTMVGGSWRYEEWPIEGHADYIAPKKLKTLTVRAAGYKTAKFKLKKSSGSFRLVGNGRVFPWETEGDPSAYSFMSRTESGSPSRWDPCVYTYSAPSGFVTITSSQSTRRTLTWSLRSGEFAQPVLAEAFAKIANDSGWIFQQVSSGANITVDISSDPGSASLSGVGGASWDNAGSFARGDITATIGSRTPTRQRVRLLMHEIGHVLGLDHAYDESQMMNSDIPWQAPAKTGAGDRAGLAQLSPSQGCVFRVGDNIYVP